MRRKGIQNVVLSVLTGALTAGAATLFIGRLPTLALTPVYVQTQVGIFFALLGVLPVLYLTASTVQGRLVTVGALVAGVGSVVGLGVVEFGFTGFARHAVVAVGFGVVAYVAVGWTAIGVERVLKLVGAMASLLFAFGILYVGLLIWTTTSVTPVLPLLLAAAAFAAIIDSVKKELAASRASP